MTESPGPTPLRPQRRARMLQQMGLLEVTTDRDGRRFYRATPEAMRVGHALSSATGGNQGLRALLRKPGG